MQPREPEVGGLISPLELIKQFPGEPFAASDRRRWVGLEALRYRYQPPNGALQPPLTHLSLVLFINTPAEFELRCDGVTRLVPPRAGSVLVVPAGTPAWWRWSTRSDSLHVFLEPGLVARVAAEAFDLDPVRASIPPLDGLDLPPLRAAMLAVNDELTTDAVGDRLATESLANLLAVHLIRNASAPRLSDRRADDPLPREKLRAVIEFVEEHLGAGPSLDEMAAIAGVSPFHFASSSGQRGCPHINTSSPAVSSGPSRCCKSAAISPWQRSPCTSASRTRASSPATSSDSSASPRGSSGCPARTA